MLAAPPINTNLGIPPTSVSPTSRSPSVSRHWATLLSPSPSSSNTSQETVSSNNSPISAVSKSNLSLPPLHTAVPLARLESYRRRSGQVSPVKEMLLRPLLPQLDTRPTAIAPVMSGTNTPQGRQAEPQSAFSPTNYLFNSRSARKRADHSQLSVLNRAFLKSPYPSTEERDRLSRKLGMTSRSVQIWFQNRRRAVKVQIEATRSSQQT